MQQLLKSDIIQKKILEIGFAKIQLCFPEELDMLVKESHLFINELDRKYLKKFIALANTDNSSLKITSQEIVKKYTASIINTHISESAEAIAGVHLIKPFGIKGKLGLHFDCNLVDEINSFSISVWIPLQDCTIWNGTLSVVPYSHQINNQQRSIGLVDPFKGYYKKFKKYSKAISVKKGEAVLFHTALLHGSNINFSIKNRLAVNYLIKPKDQSFVHYFENTETPEHFLEKYEVDDFFFKNKDISLRPDSEYKFLGLEKKKIEYLSNHDINSIINKIIKQTKR